MAHLGVCRALLRKDRDRSAMTPHMKMWRTLSLRSSDSLIDVPVCVHV